MYGSGRVRQRLTAKIQMTVVWMVNPCRKMKFFMVIPFFKIWIAPVVLYWSLWKKLFC